MRAKFINENIHVYHGTTQNFDKFDINKIGTGDGKSKGGWGIYFSDNEDVSKNYFLKSGFIKEFEIKEGNYFDLDDSLDEGLAYNIIKNLNKHNISEENIEEFKNDFIEYIPDITNNQVYEWLSYVLGSEMNASLFLKDMGYKGNTFKDKWNRNATNYVIFDTKDIVYI